MPDIFGNETPQEVSLRIRQQFAKSDARVPTSSGDQAGKALGQLFGRSVRKTLDTRKARQTDAERYAAEGMSTEDSRKLAKIDNPRQFAEQSKAMKMQKLAASAQETVAELTPTMGPELARAAGHMTFARQLREIGMHDEANKMTLQGAAIRNAENARLLAVDKAKADLSATRANTENKEGATDQQGNTPIGRLLDQEQEEILALEQADNPKDVETAQRRLAATKAAIRKQNMITGTTDTDLSVNNLLKDPTKSTANALQKHLNDAGHQMDILSNISQTYNPKYLTFEGELRNWTAGLLGKAQIPMDDATRLFTQGYNDFRATAIAGLNEYIKFITGAQMSEAEADRLRQGYPDVANDSSDQFMGKYVATVRGILAVRARAEASLSGDGLNLLPKDIKAKKDDEGNYPDGASMYGERWEDYAPTVNDVIETIGLSGIYTPPGQRSPTPSGPKVTIGKPVRVN